MKKLELEKIEEQIKKLEEQKNKIIEEETKAEEEIKNKMKAEVDDAYKKYIELRTAYEKKWSSENVNLELLDFLFGIR